MSFPLIDKVLTVQCCLGPLCIQLHQVCGRLIHPDSEGQLPRTMPHENRHHHAIITIRITILARDQSPCLVPPQLPKSCYSTCHIECLWPVHGALNVDEKRN